MKMKNTIIKDFGDGTNLWFTSDTHFGHSKIIEYCDRPFKDVDEMNEKLIENWNSVVKPEDTIFHLGDFAFGGNDIWNIANRLNGNKYLILGNHDEKNIKDKYFDMFTYVGYQYKIYVKGWQIYLNHFPFLTYGGSKWEHPVLQIHGHLHTKNGICGESPEIQNMLMKTQFDCGVDNCNYYPISFDEILKRMGY